MVTHIRCSKRSRSSFFISLPPSRPPSPRPPLTLPSGRAQARSNTARAIQPMPRRGSGANAFKSVVLWMWGEGSVNSISELVGGRGAMMQTGRLNTDVFPVPILPTPNCLPHYIFTSILLDSLTEARGTDRTCDTLGTYRTGPLELRGENKNNIKTPRATGGGNA